MLVVALVRLDSPEIGMCDPMWLPVSRPADVAFFVAAAGGPDEGGVRAELQRKSTVAFRRVDAWAAAQPTLAAREPARTMIANLKRAMGRAGR